MKIRRLLAGIGALCLVTALLFPVQVHAAEESNGTTTIITTVPDTHTVTLEIGEHGSVTTDGKEYTGTQDIKVKRLSEQKYTITPDKGYQIDTVSYGKPDSMETVTLSSDNTYTAPVIHEDEFVLKVTFKAVPDSGTGGNENADGTTSGSGNSPKTGDYTNTGLWGSLLIVSALLMAFATRKQKKIQ